MEGNVEEAVKKWHVRVGETLSNSIFSSSPFSSLHSLPAAFLLIPNVTTSWLLPYVDNPGGAKCSKYPDADHCVSRFRNADREWDGLKKDRLRLYHTLLRSLWPFLECEVSIRASLLHNGPHISSWRRGPPSADPPQPSRQGYPPTPPEEAPVTKGHLDRLMAQGNWAAALALIPRVLATPLYAARKALRICEAARPDPGVAWVGALAVWTNYATFLGLHEVGRVLTLLACAQRWREALAVYDQLETSQMDGYVFRQVAYALGSMRHRELNGLVIGLWADWRCRLGDNARPTAGMIEQLLIAGLHGSDTAAACACALVKEGLAQKQRKGREGAEVVIPGSEVMLDLEKNETVLRRLLKDRWYSESWQSALALAVASTSARMIETVARKSPPHSTVFESVLESSPLSTSGSQRQSIDERDLGSEEMSIALRVALVSHAAMTRHNLGTSEVNDTKGSKTAAPKRGPTIGNNPYSRLELQRHEARLIERILDELLGKKKIHKK
ncbi:unnamed protein product [Phytomonas sp. Hart1]|nr:unnamed protein product [Phytomonas sp. Hart1]|eukprot:CCW67878.1 unnamed protein product [Phytomonas sp. isolate Hart1]